MTIKEDQIFAALQRNPERLLQVIEQAQNAAKRARLEAQQEAQDAEAEQEARWREANPLEWLLEPEHPANLTTEEAAVLAEAVEERRNLPTPLDETPGGNIVRELIAMPPNKVPRMMASGDLNGAVSLIYNRIKTAGKQPTVDSVARVIDSALNWMRSNPPQLDEERNVLGFGTSMRSRSIFG